MGIENEITTADINLISVLKSLVIDINSRLIIVPIF